MIIMLVRAVATMAMIQELASAPPQRVRDTISAADSVRLVRRARGAQASFELFRRSALPRGQSYSGPCDVVIGRYCYWHGDDEDDDKPPPPEPEPVKARREQLIRLLDSAAGKLPGDSWLVGQRVRYLVDASQSARARAVAERECRASPSWCNALAGYASHASGDYAAADSAYERALAAMTDAERCRWSSISLLLDGDLANRHDALDCAARERFVRRAFTLAAPLYMVATVDLFTEYLTRLTRARVAERAATSDGVSWADDARDLVLRYGWPTWYSRSEPPVGSMREASIAGHDAGHPYYFFPSLHALEHPSETTSDDWRLDDRHAPMAYAPAYLRSIHEVPHQIARFRHGDSLVAVAAWDATGDTSLARRTLGSALVLTDDVEPRARAMATARDAGALWTSLVSDSGLISLELLDSVSHHAGRVRIGYGRRPAAPVWVSDLLLLRSWGGGSEATLSPELVEHAMRSDRVNRRDTLSVYWEMYGVRREPIQYALAVEQIGASWMRRAAERLHLADRTSGVRVQWDEVPSAERGYASRAVRLDLTRLRPGRYRVQLTATATGKPAATSTRDIDVQ